MAKFPNRTKVPTAITSRSTQPLDSKHVTTGNFMETGVAKYIEMVPGQSINVEHLYFNRLEPMPTPTYGDAVTHLNAFFVPYRTIMRGWNEFIDDVPFCTSNGGMVQIPNVHFFDNQLFLDFLTSSRCATRVTNPTQVKPDFYTSNFNTVENDLDSTPYRFTAYGKLCYKIFRQLGYNISFSYDSLLMSPHSALPLLSLVKVYVDWYFPNAYSNTDRLNSLLKWLNLDPINTYDEGFVDLFTAQDLDDIMSIISLVYYDSDYYTSAWDNPVSPNYGLFSDVSINDPTNPNSSVIDNINGTTRTPGIDTDDGYVITQYTLTALRSLTDYMKRHQMSSRVIDRYLSRFGITLSSEKLNRSVYIGRASQDLSFGDVTSTSDTEGAQLGAYAGKGICRLEWNCDYSTDEYGMFLIISTVVPKTSYYQGRDKVTKHISRLDFWTPEFDNLSVQPITMDEVYLPMVGSQEYADDSRPTNINEARLTSYSKVFGFQPTYAEYKVGRDVLSGDYILPGHNVGKESWNTFRDLSGYFERTGIDRPHGLDFLNNDIEQYNRIFYNHTNDFDHFNIVHLFRIKSSFPGKSLFDTYEFESEEDNAKKVTVDVAGQKAN